eukprot:2438031-Amphidinium_carterae.1
MGGYSLTRLPCQFNGSGRIFESLQMLALISSAGSVPFLRNASAIPRLMQLAQRMRHAGARCATNATFLTFATGVSPVPLTQHPSDPALAALIAELLAVGGEFTESMDVSLSGAGWLRKDPLATNVVVSSAVKMLAEGTEVLADAATLRNLIAGSTESKGLAAVKDVDFNTAKGAV